MRVDNSDKGGIYSMGGEPVSRSLSVLSALEFFALWVVQYIVVVVCQLQEICRRYVAAQLSNMQLLGIGKRDSLDE